MTQAAEEWLAKACHERAIPACAQEPRYGRVADEVAPRSARHHRRSSGWHHNDRPVRVGEIGHVASMDVEHDQEQRHHGQHPDEQRGEKPDVDFEPPIHYGVTYPG